MEPHVLRFGEQAVKSIRAKQKKWDEGIGYQEREMFEAYLGLPASQRKVVREVILAFARAFSADAAMGKTKTRKNSKARS